MIVEGTVSVVSGSLFRVNIGGSLSAPIQRTTSAFRLKIALPESIEQLPPQIGDNVICWFPGDSLCDGYIIAIVEE